jgi:hypothetical protein
MKLIRKRLHQSIRHNCRWHLRITPNLPHFDHRVDVAGSILKVVQKGARHPILEVTQTRKQEDASDSQHTGYSVYT